MPDVREHRKFGIEIECFNLREVPSIVRERGWTIKNDCSIRGDHSREIVSPPLIANSASLKEVKDIMRALRAAGGRVNRTCGLHVHIGVEKDVRERCEPGVFFTKLIQRYSLVEGFADMLVPPSRRGMRNMYCNSMNDLMNTSSYARLLEAPSIVSTEQILYSMGRYYKLNISSYIRHGTVEFRHFGASLNGTKTVAWIKFCLAFVNVCSNASLRNQDERRNYTERQWGNPTLGIVSRKTKTRLRNRHDQMLAHSR